MRKLEENIKNLNNDYPGVLDQVVSQSQILRSGNSRVVKYCGNPNLLIKISFNKKEQNFQYLICNISDGTNFKVQLLNYQMPVVKEYEAVKMSKEFGQKEFNEFEAKVKEIKVKQFEREIDHPKMLIPEKYGISPVAEALAGMERKMDLTVDDSMVDAMAYGIGAIETNDGIVKSVEIEAATDMAKTLTEGKTEFYVGQIVENKVDGKGEVECINNGYKYCPITVVFFNGVENIFTLRGRHLDDRPSSIIDIKPVPKASEDKPMTATEVNERNNLFFKQIGKNIASESAVIDQETFDNIDISQYLGGGIIRSKIPLEQPMISNDIKPPKVFNDAIVHIDWAKETAEKIKLNQTYSRASAINLETSDEIDIHQCLDEALIQIRNPPEQQPLYTGTRDRLIGSIANGRMLDADISPIPLAMKPVPEKTELTAKCALCGDPCKPRNGAKFYSICGECK